MTIGLLLVSIVVQVVAATLALRLIWVTRRSLAWIFICCALLLMSLRRCITLYLVLTGGVSAPGPDLAPSFEALVSVAISVLMLLGVALIEPVFRSILRSEEDVRRREEDLSVTLGSIAEAVVTTDTDLRIARMNPAAEQLTGWTSADATGHPLSEILPMCEVDKPDVPLHLFEPVVREGRTVRVPQSVQLARRDGARLLVSSSGAPIRDLAGGLRGAVIVVQDVTERQRLQDHARHAQRLETVGRLAGGVAHDFNNALGGILGYAELLAMKIEDDQKLRDYATNIVEAAKHARELTSRLLTFSRRGRVMTRPLDIHESIRLVANLLERTVDKKVRIEVHLDAAQTTCEGDPSQIHSALLNLGVNARDAMPSGGRLTFSTRNIAVEKPADDQATPIPPGRYVEVDVEDTGIGMGPDVMAHLFEPFFTTKPVGQGTGLGLSAVYGVVREHQGVIQVESRPGTGSAFRIFLPLTDRTAVARAAAAPVPRVKGAGVVLVADDDVIMRRLGGEVLAELGFEVLLAEDGVQAVEAFRAAAGRVDVVILDMVMPNMNGLDALRELRRLDPKIRVVFASGYETEILREGLREESIDGFLQKPYSTADLAKCLEEALRRP